VVRAKPELPIRHQNGANRNQQEQECEQQLAGLIGLNR
jgi:hypothetical protein